MFAFNGSIIVLLITEEKVFSFFGPIMFLPMSSSVHTFIIICIESIRIVVLNWIWPSEDLRITNKIKSGTKIINLEKSNGRLKSSPNKLIIVS